MSLDFTDPDSGKPLEKVCFIGSNGTGKSTILGLLAGALLGKPSQPLNNAPLEGEALTAVRLDLGTEAYCHRPGGIHA